MKYLEVSALDQINEALAGVEVNEMRITGRIEAYSCKTVGEDKRLYKTLEAKWVGDEFDDASELSAISPFGPLDLHASRKTLFYLIATLNASFPDYDFRDASASLFSKQVSLPMVANSINSSLANLGPHAAELASQMWSAVDSEINLMESDIYLFTPDDEFDPYGDGHSTSLWSFHYFFYNKKLKRIIFLTCNAENLFASDRSRSADVSLMHSTPVSEESQSSDMIGSMDGIPDDVMGGSGWVRFDPVQFKLLG